MALEDEVKNRYSSVRLIQLTNDDSQTATTINDAILTKAVEDVKITFELHGGVKFDINNDIHILIGVEGVIIRLHTYKAIGGDRSDDLWNRWKEELRDLERRTKRDPKSSSGFEPSTQPTGKPPLDRLHLQAYRANPRAARIIGIPDEDELGV